MPNRSSSEFYVNMNQKLKSSLSSHDTLKLRNGRPSMMKNKKFANHHVNKQTSKEEINKTLAIVSRELEGSYTAVTQACCQFSGFTL